MAKGVKIVLKKDKQELENQLFALYCEPIGVNHFDRITYVSELVGKQLQKNSIRMRSKRNHWEERFAEIEKQREADNKAHAKMPMAAVNGIVEVEDTPFRVIGALLKNFGFKTLSASSRLVNTLCLIIETETVELEDLLQTERTQKLTLTQRTRKETLIQSLSDKEKQVREYMKPSSVAQYLRLAGIEGSLDNSDDGIEKAAFTPDAILSAVEDLMKSKNKGEATVGPIKNIDDVDEEKIRIEQEIGVKLPEIDATKVKDEANEGLTEQETDLLQYQSLYYSQKGTA